MFLPSPRFLLLENAKGKEKLSTSGGRKGERTSKCAEGVSRTVAGKGARNTRPSVPGVSVGRSSRFERPEQRMTSCELGRPGPP